LELIKSSEAKDLVIFPDKIAKNARIRTKFIAKLQIPTYCQLTKVMFYDVLQQLCNKKNLMLFNDGKMKESIRKRLVLN
jgi:hypothetical protein